jgi:hypothetical protein
VADPRNSLAASPSSAFSPVQLGLARLETVVDVKPACYSRFRDLYEARSTQGRWVQDFLCQTESGGVWGALDSAAIHVMMAADDSLVEQSQGAVRGMEHRAGGHTAWGRAALQPPKQQCKSISKFQSSLCIVSWQGWHGMHSSLILLACVMT